jgi:glycosyltransferase involved in cell wall biosynthesis
LKLSICMMVKNEENNLSRCLDSLKYLMKKIKSELIIVDTGSSDNTVEIAKSYTSSVYFHPWNNNFSEMRNITISYAKGDWIFIIDADEELKDCTDIIKFFNQPKLENMYSSCLLRVHNFGTPSMSKRDYSYASSPRLFRNDGFFHYEGIVHNQPKSRGKVLSLDSMIWHYGYDHLDKDLMERKFIRTSELLKTELNKDPNNVYYRYQLAISYAMHEEWDKALQEIRVAYNAAKQNEIEPQSNYLYGPYALYAFVNKRYEEAEKICNEGITLESDYIDLHFYLARIYKLQGRNLLAIQSYETFLILMNKLVSLPIYRNPSLKLQTTDKVPEALLELGQLNLLEENFLGTLKCIEELLKDTYDLPISLIQQGLNLFIEAAIKNHNLPRLLELYLGLKEEQKKYFALTLEKLNRNLAMNNQSEFYLLFSKANDSYAWLNKVRISFHEKRFKDVNEYIDSFSEEIDFEMQPEYFSDLIFYILNLRQTLSEKVFTLSTEKLDLIFVYLLNTHPEVSVLLNNYFLKIETLKKEDFTKLRVYRVILKNLLLYGNLDDTDYSLHFKGYIEIGQCYIEQLYNEKVINLYDLLHLTREDRFILQVYEADKLSKLGKIHQGIHLLKSALKDFPELNKGIEVVAQELKQLTNSATTELEQHSREMKKIIESLINQDELERAMSLIFELENIVGLDSELFSMKAVILLKSGKIEEAEKLLSIALSNYPKDFDLLYNLAYIYEIKEKFTKAKEIYSQALKYCNNDSFKHDLRIKLKEMK